MNQLLLSIFALVTLGTTGARAYAAAQWADYNGGNGVSCFDVRAKSVELIDEAICERMDPSHYVSSTSKRGDIYCYRVVRTGQAVFPSAPVDDRLCGDDFKTKIFDRKNTRYYKRVRDYCDKNKIVCS